MKGGGRAMINPSPNPCRDWEQALWAYTVLPAEERAAFEEHLTRDGWGAGAAALASLDTARGDLTSIPTDEEARLPAAIERLLTTWDREFTPQNDCHEHVSPANRSASEIHSAADDESRQT